MSPPLKGRVHVVFGVDPVGVTVSCVHDIFLNGLVDLTKFAWI